MKTNRFRRSFAFLITFLTVGVGTCIVSCTSSDQQDNVLLESHDSLRTAPTGAVELMNGNYQSVMLNTPCPYRIFSPIDPKWTAPEGEDPIASGGMRLVVYILNLKGTPRPSAATDREIIEDLIADGFLVVTVDFTGGHIEDNLEFQKDINGLFCAFGGEWHAQQSYFTENRKNLLQYPGPNDEKSFTSFEYSRNGSTVTIPVNRAGLYVIPSGYTVEPHIVFKENIQGKDAKGQGRTNLFMDVVYPKPSRNTEKVPILFEGSSTGTGEFVVNANTPILYSWLFNGYAFASMGYVDPENDNNAYSVIHGLRYLQSQKERFSLSGKVGTAGISKSCARCYSESNFKDHQIDMKEDPYGNESNRVQVSMPAVGRYPESTWKNLDKDSPALVLSWNHLNGGGKSNGDEHRTIQAAYEKAGLSDKCLYFSSPLAGHEYDVYHLNEIMAFFDQHCK